MMFDHDVGKLTFIVQVQRRLEISTFAKFCAISANSIANLFVLYLLIALQNLSRLARHFDLSEREGGQVEIVGLVKKEDPVQGPFQLVLWAV